MAGGCCDGCTHTFDGTDVRMINCSDCGVEVVQVSKTGNPRKRCDECHAAAYPEPKKKYRMRHKENAERIMAENSERLLGYTWHVAPTGTAHLWGSTARLSHCGMVRGEDMKLSPVDATWPCLCKRCAAIIVRELERAS